MGYSKPSVSHAVKNLRTGGFLVIDENGCLCLTENGRTVAEKIYERRQFFMEQLIEDLYFCLENRIVYVRETEIMLTVKEFDIFALLIMNPRRVLTYEMIIDLVWHENLDYYSHRAINNHVSNLRHKLKVTPETPDYIRSVHSIGYKFNPNIELL